MTCDFLVKHSKVLTGVALGRVVAAAGQEPLAVPPAISCPCSYSLSLPIAHSAAPLPTPCLSTVPMPLLCPPCPARGRLTAPLSPLHS